jgi:hypothetical protein
MAGLFTYDSGRDVQFHHQDHWNLQITSGIEQICHVAQKQIKGSMHRKDSHKSRNKDKGSKTKKGAM